MTKFRHGPDPAAVADSIHGAAIRLLRFVRREDAAAGVGAPQLSALSVLVFGGPTTLTALAEAEQVRLPTMSRLISELEARGLVSRKPDHTDRRISRVFSTRKGRRLLEEGRKRRLVRLVAALEGLSSAELSHLASAAEAILKATRSEQDRAAKLSGGSPVLVTSTAKYRRTTS
ncbi:MAG TPA: MarR family transcriptional regulator [Rhizomicrobium sp.]